MSVRTPGLQSRSQYHAYWGQYAYQVGAGVWANGSDLLPGAPGFGALSAVEYAKLETGDIASSTDLLTANRGLFVCVDRSVNGSVEWRRLDNAAATTTQTIRDAHRIVVGIVGTTSGVPATDTLLNLSPYTAGISADFIDAGDGVALALALATAAAITVASSNFVDVRIVAGVINLEGSAVTTPLTVPAAVSLIGAGPSRTRISGKFNGEQGIFILNNQARLEAMSLSSPAPVSLPGAANGLVEASGVSAGNFSIQDVRMTLIGSAARVATAGVYASTPGPGPVSATLRDVSVAGTSAVGASTVGFFFDGYENTSILDCSATLTTFGINLFAGALLAGNGGLCIDNFKGINIDRTGIVLQATPTQALLGAAISGGYISFSDTSTTGQQEAIVINSSGFINQLSVTGLQCHWSTTAAAAFRLFGLLATPASGGIISGVSFSGCGATSPAPIAPFFSSNLTVGLELSAFDANSIIGMDSGCDFAGSIPLIPSAIIGVSGNTVLWEHVHPRGLA